MKVTFKPSAMNRKNTEETIIAHNKTIGRMYISEGDIDTYHAVLNLEGFYAITQGFGNSREEAIHDAFLRGKEYGKELIRNIEAMEQTII